MLYPELSNCHLLFIWINWLYTWCSEKSKNTIWKENICAISHITLLSVYTYIWKYVKSAFLPFSLATLMNVEMFFSNEVGYEIRLTGRCVCFWWELFPISVPDYICGKEQFEYCLNWKRGVKNLPLPPVDQLH